MQLSWNYSHIYKLNDENQEYKTFILSCALSNSQTLFLCIRIVRSVPACNVKIVKTISNIYRFISTQATLESDQTLKPVRVRDHMHGMEN